MVLVMLSLSYFFLFSISTSAVVLRRDTGNSGEEAIVPAVVLSKDANSGDMGGTPAYYYCSPPNP